MVEVLKINLYKLAALLIFAIVLLLLTTTSSVFSQSPSPAVTGAPVSGVTFPIEELGGCTDAGACMDFCNDPVNQNSCTSYAKKNGFYKDDVTLYPDDEFWKDAQDELGCNSSESCLSFCSEQQNYEACSNFAKRNEIPGGYTEEPDRPEYLEIAKEVLGCDSAQSCANFCSNPDNSDKCSEFADRVGVLGGNSSEGPGGCQTNETCRAYCNDPANFAQCTPFAPGGGTFSGPGGCSSEESCRNYCDQNPTECRSYAPGSNGAYVPISCGQNEVHGPGGVCTKIPDYKLAVYCAEAGGLWNGNDCMENGPFPLGISTEVSNAHFEPREEMGGCTTPGGCYDYCKENPTSTSCAGFDPSSPRPTDEYDPYLYYTPGSEVTHDPIEGMGGCNSPASCYDYCRANPGQCEGFSSRAPRPPEVYIPGTYYTPPADIIYASPPTTNFYTTPIYYTPPEGSNYTTPQYYTPGTYYTPSYQTPPSGSNYATPTYYSPWANYPTPDGEYPTPSYSTPTYYTPPIGSNYTTPYYYTPPPYTTPYYYTPPGGSNYTTPSYSTPPPYTTPQYYTPINIGTYTSPVYFTPPVYQTPVYYTPPPGSNYTSPSYYTPPIAYTTPRYYTPGIYPTPVSYSTPPPYTTPQYFTPPPGSNYTSPTYYSPTAYTTPQYYTPPPYSTPYYYTPYTTPTYSTPPEGSNYTSPSYYTPYTTPSGYTYPTPGSSYYYPSPGGIYSSPDSNPTYYSPPSSYYSPYATPGTGEYTYPTPGSSYSTPASYSYPTPGTGYSYPTPYYGTPGSGYSYPSPSYGTPSYGTPSYGTPSYGTPSYGTPSYGTPSYDTPSYSYPSPVQGVTSQQNFLQRVWYSLTSLFGR